MKYNAILIDPKNQIIDEIEVGEGKIAEVIGCEYFAVGARLENGDVLYVDDMGLMNGIKDGFYWKHTVLVGRGIVIGCNKHGDTQDVISRIGQIEDIVKFVELTDDYIKKSLNLDVKFLA